MINEGVSVIICCYNSALRISETLRHLQLQVNADQIPWEVLIIDNASTDNTSEIARSIWKHKTPLHVILEKKPGLSNARMAGIANAKYELLSFIDDDNWVNENWINQVFHTMKAHPEVGICGGIGEPVFETEPPLWFKKFEQAFAVGSQGEKEGYVDISRGYLYGAGSTLRKSAWTYLESKGFSYLLTGRKGKGLSSGEDMELCIAAMIAGFKLWYNPDLKFKHFITANRLNWKYLVKLSRALGKSDPYTELYAKHLYVEKGLKNKIKTHALLSIPYIIYFLLKQTPAFIKAKLGQSEGKNSILTYNRYFYCLIERIKVLPNIRYYDKKITGAAWFQLKISPK